MLLISAARMYETEFYFGNICSTSSTTKAVSRLYNFEIKVNQPAFRLYDELPVYRAYFNTSQVQAATIGVNYAFLGIRQYTVGTRQTTMWIKNIILMVDDAGDEVILSAYKNPNFSSGAPNWSVIRERAQFTSLVNTLIINNANSFPWACSWTSTVSGVGDRLIILEFPERTLGLFDENDEIYISVTTVNTTNVDCHVSMNYYY